MRSTDEPSPIGSGPAEQSARPRDEPVSKAEPPPPPVSPEDLQSEITRLRGLIGEFLTAYRGKPVGGGDGGTFAIGYPSAELVNRAIALLREGGSGSGDGSSVAESGGTASPKSDSEGCH